MAALVTKNYEITDFIGIAFQKNKYPLSDTTISVIQDLNNKFNPGGTCSSLFPSHFHSPKKLSSLSSFSNHPKSKLTSPIKVDEPNIAQVRSLINKISEQNFDDILGKLIKLIDTIIDTKKEDLQQLSTLIVDLASTNIFYSKIYAKLYFHLQQKYEFLKSQFNDSLNQCKDNFNEFRYSNPSDNYALFCEINKENEKRKAIVTFLINLVEYKVISYSEIVKLQNIYLNLLKNNINLENKTDLCNEIVENLFLLSRKDISESEDYEKFIKECDEISKLDTNKFSSLSKKSIFKLMDILES